MTDPKTLAERLREWADALPYGSEIPARQARLLREAADALDDAEKNKVYVEGFRIQNHQLITDAMIATMSAATFERQRNDERARAEAAESRIRELEEEIEVLHGDLLKDWDDDGLLNGDAGHRENLILRIGEIFGHRAAIRGEKQGEGSE